MITGHLNRWPLEAAAYGPRMRQAMDFLTQTDLAGLATGQHEIDGPHLFAIVQEVDTERAAARRWESHDRYTDIQLLLDGEEQIGFADQTGSVESERHDDRDLVFYSKAELQHELQLLPGMYAVFFPQELHRPCCTNGEPRRIRKIVVKIDLNG
ncbi:YhcH/YjgK/YiaL family protein [Paenibacillus sp. IB182496]|uniref:YhcH/YjgK/YiaL family protein n=1 Tax=Paenibacillus sabuli TaxID=2772509 RepID=A0A927GSB0_9BACL|nr:YhcH/YjgK/YiaL family protein [Paenibacillus sabuli]MBD2845522.1 YhcH/YjgK/YiaL family protein [Paenibacillus sabuli]